MTDVAKSTDNYSSRIAHVAPQTEISKKTNNPYHVLVVQWLMPNDQIYTSRHFITDEQKALIEMSISAKSDIGIQFYFVRSGLDYPPQSSTEGANPLVPTIAHAVRHNITSCARKVQKMAVFPTDTVADFIASISGVLTANIGVVLGILAFMFGLRWIMRLFNSSTRGRLQSPVTPLLWGDPII